MCIYPSSSNSPVHHQTPSHLWLPGQKNKTNSQSVTHTGLCAHTHLTQTLNALIWFGSHCFDIPPMWAGLICLLSFLFSDTWNCDRSAAEIIHLLPSWWSPQMVYTLLLLDSYFTALFIYVINSFWYCFILFITLRTTHTFPHREIMH